MWYFGKVKNTEEWGFSKTKDTFDKCAEMSDKEHDLLVKQVIEQNKWISGDKDGNPIIVDPPQPTPEEQKRARIKELERFLSYTDWYAIRFADTGEEIPADIKQQRQDARDEISRLREELNSGE